MAGPLVRLKCENGCPGILGRGHLEGESTVEIKCDECKRVNSFISQPNATALVADGQGGFLTVPSVNGYSDTSLGVGTGGAQSPTTPLKTE